MTLSKVVRFWPLFLATAAVGAQAPADTAALIVNEGLKNSHVMEFQHHLCNNIGARLTGSDNFTLACEWARSEFEKMGLEARLEEWDEWKIVWNRGQWSGRVISPMWGRGGWGAEGGQLPLELQIATPAWTAGTKGKVRGVLALMPESQEELDQLVPRLGEVYLYGRRPGRGSSMRDAFNEAIAETPPLGFVQSAGSTGMADRRYENQIRVFGNHLVAKGSWESLPTIPEIVVRDDQADLLEEMLESGEEVVVDFDIRNRFRQGPIKLNNVIADLKGTEKPDEFVIICGHLDSWHQAAGATDNGTGTTSTLEAARILAAAGAKPKRTIRFILWGGEEQGLLGSAKYTQIHRQELDKVSAVFNHDTGTNWAHALTVANSMYEPLKTALAPLFSLPVPQKDYDGEVFVLTKRETMGGGGGGSDHASFLSKGIPAWSWGLEGESSYGYGWHSQWDTYDIVVPEYQRHTATVAALASLGVANLPDLLPRDGIRRGGGGRGLAGLIDREYGLAVADDLTVSEVKAKSAGARAGIKKGDVLKTMWDKDLESPTDIYRAWRENRESDVVEFTYERDGVVTKSSASLEAEESDSAGGAGTSGRVIKVPVSQPTGEEKKKSSAGTTSRKSDTAATSEVR